MAHDLAIDQKSGEVAMFYDLEGGTPWHELGQAVRGCVTWEEAMQKAHLDFEVIKEQLSAPDRFGGSKIPAWGIFRADTGAFLGAAGAHYTPIQNRMAFEFVDALLSVEDGAHYESAGALGNGERIWCLARIPHDITIAGTEDKSLSYLMFCTSHDGSLAAQAKITSVRVVCRNTLTAAVNGNGQMLRVKHTKEAQARLDAAQRLMSKAVSGVKDLEEKLNLLALRKMTRESYEAVMDRLFPKAKGEDGEEKTDSGRRRNTLDEIAQLFADNDRDAIPEVKGTAYALLNGVTNFADHFRMTRVTDSRPAYTIAQSRAESALFGSGAALKENALDIILEETMRNPLRDAKRILALMPATPLLEDAIAQSISSVN